MTPSTTEWALPPRARIDLGCGGHKRGSEYVGIDLLELPGVDIVGEAREVLSSLPAGSVAEVYSSHFFEHISDPASLLAEVCRVLEPGGLVEIVVPHFSNPYFYSDLTHQNPYGLYTLDYLIASPRHKRHVPTYSEPLPLLMESIGLEFKSPPPFYGRYAFKRLVGLVINSGRGVQEFYEENLCWLVPCYQVRFVLRRA